MRYELCQVEDCFAVGEYVDDQGVWCRIHITARLPPQSQRRVQVSTVPDHNVASTSADDAATTTPTPPNHTVSTRTSRRRSA